MTVLEALEDIKANMYGIGTQHFAGMEEANIPADFYDTAQYPLQIILPFEVVDNPGTSGALKSAFELHFFMLNKHTTQTTVEYKAREVENAVVAPMRLLARKYMHKLMEHSIIDPEVTGPVTNIRYIPAYSSMDADLHGVEVIAQVSVQERPSVCIP